MIKEIKEFALRTRRTIHDPNIAKRFPEAYHDEKILTEILVSDFSAREKYFTVANLMSPVFWHLSEKSRGHESDFSYPESFIGVTDFVHSQPLDALVSKVNTAHWEKELEEAVRVLTVLFESKRISNFKEQPEFKAMVKMLAQTWSELREKFPDLNEMMDD